MPIDKGGRRRRRLTGRGCQAFRIAGYDSPTRVVFNWGWVAFIDRHLRDLFSQVHQSESAQSTGQIPMCGRHKIPFGRDFADDHDSGSGRFPHPGPPIRADGASSLRRRSALRVTETVEGRCGSEGHAETEALAPGG